MAPDGSGKGARPAGPSSVAELAARLPISRPAVSQHLTILRRSRLVTYEESGTRNVYRLDPAGLRDLRTWMDGFWEEAPDAYAEAARKDAQDSMVMRDLPDD
jgi:DNA-binding transcriptional ArsR family regulator